jgi:hypothetical protein
MSPEGTTRKTGWDTGSQAKLSAHFPIILDQLSHPLPRFPGPESRSQDWQ